MIGLLELFGNFALVDAGGNPPLLLQFGQVQVGEHFGLVRAWVRGSIA